MSTPRNNVQLIGHVGNEPETTVLESGKKMTRFSLATNENYRNEKGEKVQTTDWHNLVAWGKKAEIVERYAGKVKNLAETADCFWLITDVSVIAKSLTDRTYFITIDFKKLSEDMQDAIGYEAIIEYGDGNGNVLETHRYHATDFPLDKLRLFLTEGTLMLPSEY